MYKFINLETRQSTLESSYKEAREKCARKSERCIHYLGFHLTSLGLPFNITQTPYWKEMIEEVRSFGRLEVTIPL